MTTSAAGSAVRLALAGFAATAVAYGPSRVGYGLFLPQIQEEFGLTTQEAGAVASGLQAGFLVALLATVLLVARLEPRTLVAAGGAAAIVGMSLVALSPTAATVTFGVVLAGMSAGFSWSPYNDLARALVARATRARALSVVSTGTTLGIAGAGLVALTAAFAGLPWRAAWLGFVVGAVVSAAINAMLLPRAASVANAGRRPWGRPKVGWLVCDGSLRLFSVAAVFGGLNAFYWSFNVDLLSRGGMNLPNAGPILYVVLGAAGFAGLFTGDLVERFGLRLTLRATLLCLGVGAGLLGLAPGSLAAVGASSVVYGSGVMLMSALLSLWSSTVFRGRPSAGFTATLLCFGAGGVIGPVALGTFGGLFGLGSAFAIAAALAFLMALLAN